ncbi:sensor histidine kinase [Microlunatus elymi]|uniref:Sensor histidine kinase n=1 Tax=Microlunatus elymi TaxID=2596828 RepID=A0A516PY29_9ACTN|nr:sensor histidine kinase [Microlunatus elymi]QDP96052.1 sensor histidine kinase [Microlunatus elymi]
MSTSQALANRPAELRRIDRVVDVALFLITAICAARFVTNHGLSTRGTVILVAAGVCLLVYALGVVGEPSPLRQRVAITAAAVIWIGLVISASSFAWCAFPLFFAIHRVHSGRTATVLNAGLVAAVAISLYLLSGGRDFGLVIGPIAGGVVLSMAYATLERLFDARQKLINDLITTRDQLAASERNAGMLTERHRVAVELHDTVVQGTASELLLLEAADQTWAEDDHGPARTSVREAEQVLRDNLSETRRMLHRLASERLSGQDLGPALQDLADETGAELQLVGNRRALPAEVQHALLRVAQEAITNARKHAEASMIKITLTFHHDEVGVDVADNGIGFDADQPGESDEPGEPGERGGYGLRAMAWRVQNLGGEFTVESRPGGTVIAATVPIDDTPADVPDPAGEN